MSRILSLSALAAGALLALTACGGGGDAAASASSSAVASESSPETPSASASESVSAVPSASATAVPSVPAAGSSATGRSAEELAAVLATIAMPDGAPLTVVPPEQIDAMAQQGLQSIEGVVVTPEECGAVFEAAAQMPEGTRYAVGAAVNPTDQSATIITLTELDGAEELMRSQQGDAEARAETCSTYQVELQGETATGESTLVETANESAISTGARGVLILPTGQKQNTTTVSAARGSISVTAISQSMDSPAADIPILEGLVDQVLAAVDQE